MKRVVNKDNLKKFIDLINGKPNKPVKGVLNKLPSTGKPFKPNSEYAKKLTKKQTKEMIDVIKNTPSPTKPNNEWEKEFDEQFKSLANEYCDPTNDVKDFISKTLQQQREEIIKEIEGIVGEDEDFEIEAPYMQHIKDSGTDCCFCSLCCGSEMDIQDTEKNGEYFCKCSVWDSSYEGNWIRWNIPETEVKKIILRHFPIPEDFRNQLRKEIRERLNQITNLKEK